MMNTLPDPKSAEDEMRAMLTGVVEEVVNKTMPSVIERHLEHIGLSEEPLGLLRLLATKSGENLEVVLRKALTLYGLALDAVEEGNKLAILSQDDEIIQEIIGFDTLSEFHQPIGTGTEK